MEIDQLIALVSDPRQYFFWLLVVSTACLVAERLRPWRREQALLRPQLAQDLFWLVWNGHFLGGLVRAAGLALFAWLLPWMGFLDRSWVASLPLALQVVSLLVVKDFLDWCIHNLLHRVGWLWVFHKVHHSIEQMDWIGNFRFHPMEKVVYDSLTYAPLLLLGASPQAVLLVAIVATAIGHLNHSNLDLSYGPLRYLVNSPRMHIWHHARDLPAQHPSGANFGVVLSVWDWLFGTAWWPDEQECPEQQPSRLGFPRLESYPRSLAARLLVPFTLLGRRGT